jgi:hypothetical protein
MKKRTISYSLCLALAAAGHITSAAVVPLVSTNTSTSLGTGLFSAQTQLDSVTIGATTYTEVTFGTPGMVPASGTDLNTLLGADNGTIRVMYASASSPYTLGSDATAAQADQFITTGQANLLQDDASGNANGPTTSYPVNFEFGTTFLSSADVYITAFEFGATGSYDSVTLQLLNVSGATVGNTVTVSGGSWGDLIGSQDYDWADDNSALGSFTVGGAAIPLSDFGFTGTIAGVQMSAVGGADIGGIGFVAVPEPSTYAILAGMLSLGFVMLRRRLRD